MVLRVFLTSAVHSVQTVLSFHSDTVISRYDNLTLLMLKFYSCNYLKMVQSIHKKHFSASLKMNVVVQQFCKLLKKVLVKDTINPSQLSVEKRQFLSQNNQ